MNKLKSKLKYTQNFLKSSDLVETIISRSNLNKNDYVVEIGPGKGIITKELAKTVQKVTAIEYDQSLFKTLQNMFSSKENIDIIEQNFLDYKLPKNINYKIFASIPFNITADIIKKITKISKAPQDAYLIIQEEAAWKYAGQPYYSESLRSLLLKPYFVFEIIHRFNRTDFQPVPNVEVVMLHIKKRKKQLIKKAQKNLYRDFIAYIFSQNNNGLKNKCKNLFTYKQIKRLARDNNFKLKANPTDLSFDQWYQLFQFFSSGTGISREKKKVIKGAYSRLFN